MKGLTVRPIELRDANAFIRTIHRHHGGVQGHRFSLGCFDVEGKIRGCAVAGRPTSGLDPSRILEVTRLCSDGTENVCSMLYSAVARAAKAMGFERVQTYIFSNETGTSLKASGWQFARRAHPSGRHRARTDGEQRNLAFVGIEKTLWVKDFVPDLREIAHHRRRA